MVAMPARSIASLAMQVREVRENLRGHCRNMELCQVGERVAGETQTTAPQAWQASGRATSPGTLDGDRLRRRVRHRLGMMGSTPGQGGGGGGGAKGGVICAESAGRRGHSGELERAVAPEVSAVVAVSPAKGGGPAAGASIALAELPRAGDDRPHRLYPDISARVGQGVWGVIPNLVPWEGLPGWEVCRQGLPTLVAMVAKVAREATAASGGGVVFLERPFHRWEVSIQLGTRLPALTGTSMTTVGAKGSGGLGGNSNAQSNAGADGIVCAKADFAHAGACQN